MASRLDLTDERILDFLYGGLPNTVTPFADAAAVLGIAEQELLHRLRQLIESGVVRRIAASLAHRKVGITSNAVCAWSVPGERVEDVGQRMAEFDEVTHCYERETTAEWPYNMYTVVHGRTDAECEAVIERIRQAVGIDDFVIAYSVKEFKKQSARI